MANRREFIKSGLVLSGATLLPAAPLRATAAGLLRPELDCFVFDTRFQEALALAELASQQGIPLAATTGDLTELWYDHLDLRWKEAPATLAGVTTQKALFVLETLAADRRMAVIYRAAHDAVADAPHASLSDTALVSWLIAPRAASARRA
jgi:hypothetical protein